MTEQFRLRKIIKFRTILNALYPAVMLVGGIALGMVASSSNFMEVKWWFPLFILGAGVWLIYDVVKIVQDVSFYVEVSDEGITINNTSARWEDIKEIQENPNAIEKKAAVVLDLNNGSVLQVPAGLDGLPYVRGVITSKVEQKKSLAGSLA